MQHIINIIYDLLKAYVDARFAEMSGIIVAWKGFKVNIPDGWVMCDGTNGTPDLRLKFVFGAANDGHVDTTGGTFDHAHPGESVHTHRIGVGKGLVDGTGAESHTGAPRNVGNTGTFSTMPPYYMLFYIMKL